MNGKTKGILFLIFGVLALVVGNYFAGWLTLWLLKLSNVKLQVTTYWQYWRALDLPQLAPYIGKIKISGALGYGLPLLAWLSLLIALFKARPESLHGDASLAGMADLKKAGFLKQTPQGILVGKYKGRYLWLNGAQHVIVISPTRSGKTTSIAIPVLLTYEESMVVMDLKGELQKATSGWREARGQLILVWAPYDEARNTHRFNPFTLLAGMDAGRRLGDIQTIAALLYPDEPGKDPFWTSQSRAAFAAFASYMFEAWDQLWRRGLPSDPNTVEIFPSFERIVRFSGGADGQSTKEMLQHILKEPKNLSVNNIYLQRALSKRHDARGKVIEGHEAAV